MQHRTFPEHGDSVDLASRHRSWTPSFGAPFATQPGNLGSLRHPSSKTLSPTFRKWDTGPVSPNGTSPTTSSPIHATFVRDSIHTGFAPGQLNTHKRAYRQRRKDPSCDACRERKVKCDSIDFKSCNECSSRNVRCQFTKDTNRRMSSIKQLQDLERQLQDLKDEIERKRSTDDDIEPQRSHESRPIHMHLDLPDITKSPRRMLKARTPYELSNVRKKLCDAGRGLLKPPVHAVRASSRDPPLGRSNALPQRDLLEPLLRAYYESVHQHLPILHWPQFYQEFWDFCLHSSSHAISRTSYSLFFAVLGCGAAFFRCPNSYGLGQDLMREATKHIDVYSDDHDITSVVVTFLHAVFWLELNCRTAAWMWLGTAVRLAHHLGLHIQGGSWSLIDGEMRKRIWYSIYVWDRIMSIELGKPMLIDDDEFDVEYPAYLGEEHSLLATSSMVDSHVSLIAQIQVARLLSPLCKTSRSLCMTVETISKFDCALESCLQSFPSELGLSSPELLEPLAITALIRLQNARFILHRHNLSPACSPEQRTASIDQCAAVARDTSRRLSATVVSQFTEHEHQQRFVACFDTLICTHIWRCLLMLAFRGIWEDFFALVVISSRVDNAKNVNISCGRHLLEFLQLMLKHFANRSAKDLDQNEELLVFLSGDLQSGVNSWIWGNSETGTLLSRRQKHGRSRHSMTGDASTSAISEQMSWKSDLTEDEQTSWAGWDAVKETAGRLRQYLPDASERNGRFFADADAVQITRMANQSPIAPGFPNIRDNGGSRSRMNIANII